ncbi:MAG: aminopeptidase P family N-terminal domain-containing protein, partial [Prevotellaceae bacterium]|nr:aminopeptidase P family N-terminal domain-containing protein [Prevotellaceae bacterium]
MNKNARSVSVVELRQAMQWHGISACIIPSADPHLSEYPSNHWKTREWLSGFDGSAGTLVVTGNSAGLWTDSRYWLQAEKQLKNTDIILYKDGLPETPDFIKWLSGHLPEGSKIAVDGKCVSTEDWHKWEKTVSLIDLDLPSEIWTNRPPLPSEPFFTLDIKYSGRSALEKLADLRAEMRKQKADICLLTALDDIAWLLNIRAKEILYNPVVTAFAVVEMENVILFHGQNYTAIYSYFSSLQNNPTCLVDISKTNFSLYK